MKWTADKNDPPLIGGGYRVLVDGEEVHRVTAFDTDQGWVEKLCTGEKRGHPEEPHEDPEWGRSACVAPPLYGRVELLGPEDVEA